MKNFDIIIINYNSSETAKKCINSIKKNSTNVNLNIIVVDNASVDNPDKVLKEFCDITLILNKINLGYSKAINRALSMCKAPYIVILNPDTIILDARFSDIYDYFETFKSVGVVGPEILDPDGSVQGSARKFPKISTSFFGRRSPITRIFPNNTITRKEFFSFNEDPRKIVDVDWISGACMFIRRKAINQVNGFSEDFFLYWEDADLCKRIKNLGWKIIYYREAKITHLVGRSSSTKPMKSIYHFHKSCYIYYVKHSVGYLRLLIPLAFIGLSLRGLVVLSLNRASKLFKRQIQNRLRHFQKEKTINQRRPDTQHTKILRVASRLNIGGPAIHVTTLSEKLNAEKYKTTLISGSISVDEGDMGYLTIDKAKENWNYIKIPELQREINPIKDLIAFLKIFGVIIREKPDVLHTHMSKAGALSRSAIAIYNTLRKKKTKVIHTYHGHVLEGYFSEFRSNIYSYIERILGKSTDMIIAISQSQFWEISEKYNIVPKEKIRIIPLGFDLSRFARLDFTNNELRSNIGASKDDIVISIVGRLVPIKNHFLFIDTADILVKECNNALKFVIVGDGELRDALEGYSKSKGLSNHLYFYGWEKNIENIYSNIDILVLTSINEGTPVSIIEAMASSIPVITTGVGGIKDLLGQFDLNQQGSVGFMKCDRGLLCPTNDPNGLANGINFIIQNRNEIVAAKIKNASEYVHLNYTYQKLVSNIENLYDDILK